MDFPKGAGKKQKKFIKEIYIENLKKSVEYAENRIKDYKEAIIRYRKSIRENNADIKRLTEQIKDAEDTKVD